MPHAKCRRCGAALPFDPQCVSSCCLVRVPRPVAVPALLSVAARGAQAATALMGAAMHDQVEVAMLLIEKGADKDARNKWVSRRRLAEEAVETERMG